MAPLDQKSGLKRLTAEQLHFFETEGYLAVQDLFTPGNLAPLREEVEAKFDRIVLDMVTEGAMPQDLAFPEEGLNTRYVKINNRSRQHALEIMRRLNSGPKGIGYSGNALFQTIAHRNMLAVIEDLVGPEIVCSSVFHIRAKLPDSGEYGIVPWHQDSGYWMPHCDDKRIITCWLPLVEATVENGCLQIVPRAHNNGIVRHYYSRYPGHLEILEEDLPEGGEPVHVPLALGGGLFFTNRTPHRSLSNRSDIVRWSFDIRYQSADAPSNVGLEPEDFSPDRSESEIACWPPRADALIHTERRPEHLIRTNEQFYQVRTAYADRFDHSRKWMETRWSRHSESR